jgi:hypothetical protein
MCYLIEKWDIVTKLHFVMFHPFTIRSCLTCITTVSAFSSSSPFIPYAFPTDAGTHGKHCSTNFRLVPEVVVGLQSEAKALRG